MGKLDEVPFAEEVKKTVHEFLKNSKDSCALDIIKSLDSAGFTDTKTMQLIGLLQRKDRLKVGLYNKFVEFNERLKAAAAASKPAVEEVTHEAVTIAVPGRIEQVENKTSVDPNTGGSAVTQETKDQETVQVKGNFTEKEEIKIRERVKKEEEKARSRIAKREAKIRERFVVRAEKRAARIGMKVEEAQAIKERKEKLKDIRTQRKALAEQSKVLRTEILQLRPKHEKKAKAEKSAKA